MNYPLLLSAKNIAFSIETIFAPHIVWIGFTVLVGIFIAVSLGLLYHWITYGFTPFKAGAMAILYFLVSIILIATIFISLELYTKNF